MECGKKIRSQDQLSKNNSLCEVCEEQSRQEHTTATNSFEFSEAIGFATHEGEEAMKSLTR